MKILYLVSGIGPKSGWGTEFIQSLIENLSQKGIKATIINPVYKHTPKKWKEWSNLEEKLYGIKIVFIEFPAWIEKHLLLSFAVTPIYVTLKAIQILIKEKFDIVHEFSSTPIILARSFIFKYIFKIPTIFTLSVYNNTLLGKLFWIKLFNFPKYYLIPSKEIINQIQSLGVNKTKIVYSPPGINLKAFTNLPPQNLSRKVLNLPKDKFIFSYFGSLTKEKGVKDLVKAFEILDPDIKKKIVIAFFAIWKGSHAHKEIKTLITKINSPSLKFFERYIDIRKLLSASDCIVLPHQTGHGATIPPISVVETLASGKPLITSPTIGVRELFSKERSLLIQTKNPKVLAQTIEKMYKKRHALKLKTGISEQFDIQKSINLHLGLYKKINN